MELTDLPNIGKTLSGHLSKAGITTPDQLRATGAEEAWLRIRLTADPGACLHELTALAGAVAGIPKKDLPEARKAELKAFFNTHK